MAMFIVICRIGDLSKEAILQAIKDKDLRFLQVRHHQLQIAHIYAGRLVVQSDIDKILIGIFLLRSFLEVYLHPFKLIGRFSSFEVRLSFKELRMLTSGSPQRFK